MIENTNDFNSCQVEKSKYVLNVSKQKKENKNEKLNILNINKDKLILKLIKHRRNQLSPPFHWVFDKKLKGCIISFIIS